MIEDAQYKSVLKELELLIDGRIDPDSTQKVKKCANQLIEQDRANELLDLLNQKFTSEKINNYKPHLLSVVSSIYSTISPERSLEYIQLIFEKVKPIPNMIISNLLRNCRKSENYYVADNVADNILLRYPHLLESRDINILYELVFYYDFKGDKLQIRKILETIEKKFSSNKLIIKNLQNLYLKYGTIEDINRLNQVINPLSPNKGSKERSLASQDSSNQKYIISGKTPLIGFNTKEETKNEFQEFSESVFLEKMQAYEQKAKQAILSEMVNGISHEFGQPITNIKYLIQYNERMLEEKISREEVLKLFSSILEEIERLGHLVKTIAPITSSKSTIEKFNILERFQKRFEANDVRLKENKITYKINCSEPDLQLFQDPIKFDQIINNLLLNSIDSLSEKKIENKWIQVDILSKNNKIYMDFKDNGLGIPDTKRKKIFIPFYTTKVSGKGEGLGLYIVWNLLKMMDGRIDLDYSYNDGACFKIEIPMNQEGDKQ